MYIVYSIQYTLYYNILAYFCARYTRRICSLSRTLGMLGCLRARVYYTYYSLKYEEQVSVSSFVENLQPIGTSVLVV